MKIAVFQAVLLAALLAALLAGCAKHHSGAPMASGKPGTTPYTKPLTSLGAKYGALPLVVQTTVCAEVGGAELADVAKKATADRVYYIVYFKDSELYPPIYVGADGAVLNPDLTVAVAPPLDATGGTSTGPVTQVTLSDLPPGALKMVRDMSADAEIGCIKRETWGSHVVYTILFKDEAQHPKLHVVADGTLLIPAPK
jgi:hypothetical protein